MTMRLRPTRSLVLASVALLGAALLLGAGGCGARSSPGGYRGDGGRRDGGGWRDGSGWLDSGRRDGGEATFSCTPTTTGTGCSAPDTTFGKAGQPGLIYPVGCQVTYPFPHPFYPDSPATCQCDPWQGAPDWVCPL